MKKSKIILIVVFLAAAAAVLYFAYGVVKSRYLAPKTNSLDLQQSEEMQNPPSGQAADSPENSSADMSSAAPGDGRPNIQNADCDNDCASFKDNAENLKYCQEACGDRPVAPKESESQCENLAGLEKDSCWRDLAVSKKDSTFCKKISDAKLQKVCKNRVTEEILN